MTNDERLNHLSEKIKSLPDEPPIIVAPSRSILVVSLVQFAFVVIALIGVVFSIIGLNGARVATCEADNDFRLEVAGVLYDAQRPTATPESREYLERQISRFSLVDCKTPANPRKPITREMVTLTGPPSTTSTSTP